MGDMLATRREYRLREWAGEVERCRLSGMSNRAYCAQAGISEKTYYYWLRRLREAAVGAAQTQLVEVGLGGSGVDSGMATGSLTLRYGGAELVVTAETPGEILLTVLRVLKGL